MRNREPYGFWEISRSAPDAVAVVDVAGREWSAGEMLSRCRQMAGWMKARGLSPGDVVAAALPDSAFLLQLALAALESGLYFAPLDPALTQAEMEFIRNDSGAVLFVDQRAVEGLLEELESISDPGAS
ncbi:MAG: AMP-binding protein, partial [Candidatus Eremiobacteraeota bacterium]|nr:AMP-binding protein [Candidatus Eremiobacteraeota bacterium]